MAGPAPDFQYQNASIFNIYTDAPLTNTTTPSPNLPGGPCNYVDLTHGANGQKCGCRRFWSRTSFGTPTGYPPGFTNGYEDQTTWCMCSHHACFHDDARDGSTPIATPVGGGLPNTLPHMNGQENERPKANREPLTPVMTDLSFKFPHSIGQHIDLGTFTNTATFSHSSADVSRPNNAVGTSREPPSMPDTLEWASMVQREPEPDPSASLPPIPSQCLMLSQPSSTTSSARIAYLKPFSGKGLQTLSGVKSKGLETTQENNHTLEPQDEDEDIIEPDIDPTVDADDGQTVTNTPRSARHADFTEGPPPSPVPGMNRQDFHLLSSTVQGHERRIENLESISFSAAGHDLCHEKHDHADLRVTELESRVEEVEKILNDSSSTISCHNRSRREKADDATASVVSVSTSTGSYIMDRAELQSELENLKSQLSQLQGGVSHFPAPTRPWEVEVVFLPFPLKNIWLESRDFGSQRLSPRDSSIMESDPWTQLPHSHEPSSPAFSDWAGPEVDSDWLLGRACAPDNIIGQRLRSRGLVKNVTVRGPDARSVQQAMSEAFGTLFRTFSRMQANVHHGSTIHDRVTKFLGLQSPWVPLRKIHKDSRLRFLTPAEMVTPVSWDVQFLLSSVVMKSHGVQRLFITHPEAYLQDQDAYENGWTWQRLRELSRVYADSQSSSQEFPEGDAKEECWAWNTILDESSSIMASHPLSVQAVRTSAQDHWRAISASSSHDIFLDARATTPSSRAIRRSTSRAQSSAILQERRRSKPPYIRTTSMPPALQALVSPAVGKRRISTNGLPYEQHVSPQPGRAAQMVAMYKRRNTRSPSVRPRLNRYTPRWSTSSPSPLPEIQDHRATTPFYATPYSNAPFVDTRPDRGGIMLDDDEDDDIDFDFDGIESCSDIDVYDEEALQRDEDEEEDDNDEDEDDSSMADLGHDSFASQSQESCQDGHGQGPETQTHEAPEDEPWPGIEDVENRNPEVHIHMDDDVMTDDDVESQGSSTPSEYPSNEPPWITSGRSQEFRVFEDR